MKIASWNVNSLRVRQSQVADWLKQQPMDVLCLQETKMVDEDFPEMDFLKLGYRSAFIGQKTYNGVAILSKTKPEDVRTEIPNFPDEQRRVVAATFNDVRVINLYVVNGKAVGDEKYDYKLRWLEAVTAWVADELTRHEKLVVCGDFNIAPDDRDVHDPEQWADKILCSQPERDALQGLLNLGLHDSYRLFHDQAGQYTWWDYRTKGFERGLGLRIDLCLISDALKASCVAADIDTQPRGWVRPSDHTPAWVQIDADS